MRANRKFLNEVEKKVAKMSKDKAMSYLRGAISVGGNTATTDGLRKIRERLVAGDVKSEPKPEATEAVTVKNEQESLAACSDVTSLFED